MSADPGLQPGILAGIPAHARFVTLRRRASGPGPREALVALSGDPGIPEGRTVVGLGASLLAELGARVEGLRPIRAAAGPGFSVPSTPAALLVWLRGDEPGELVHDTRTLIRSLAPAFAVESIVTAFRYRGGLDLSGYEDGTENPTGDAAVETAAVSGSGVPGIDGSSFCALQRWVHDLDRFASFPSEVSDHLIGRRLADNEEIADAPAAAHVKRTEQEAADPPAFLLRRSMPWAEGAEAGLMFVSFSASLDPFEHHLGRMTGADDGITDHLFRFTRPVTGATFWCPAVADGRLDLTLLP